MLRISHQWLISQDSGGHIKSRQSVYRRQLKATQGRISKVQAEWCVLATQCQSFPSLLKSFRDAWITVFQTAGTDKEESKSLTGHRKLFPYSLSFTILRLASTVPFPSPVLLWQISSGEFCCSNFRCCCFLLFGLLLNTRLLPQSQRKEKRRSASILQLGIKQHNLLRNMWGHSNFLCCERGKLYCRHTILYCSQL